MDQAELTFTDELVMVEPGQVARTAIKLRNTSDRVLRFSLRPAPTSPAAGWMTIVPDSISLLELDDGEAEVIIQAPTGAGSLAGRLPIAVVADPGEGPLLPSVAEADVAVGAVHALDASLVPRQVRARLRGKLRVSFHNLGNEEVRLSVAGSDESDNEKLHFATADGRIAVPAGGTADGFMKVRPDKPLIIGKPVEHPFVVNYQRRTGRSAQMESTGEAEVAAALNGSFSQRPIIAKWMMVVAALVVAIAALVFFVRRATAADDPVPAPAVPVLESDREADGVLTVLFSVTDNPQFVEVQLVEAPPGGNWDLAIPATDERTRSEEDGTSRRVEVPLEESVDATDVFYRFRSVDAEGRSSIWGGDSLVQGSSITFDAPVITRIENTVEGIRVEWTRPANAGEATLDYLLRNADTGTPIDEFTLLQTATNGALIPVDGDPFAVQVRAVNRDEPTELSDWSEARAPENEQPEAPKLAAPTISSVEWNPDGETVTVAWTWEDTTAIGPVSFDLAQSNLVGIATGIQGTQFEVEMPRPDVFSLVVRAVSQDTGEASLFSEPVEPSGPRPAPPTTTAATTTTTTTTTTTLPPLPGPVDFWILPQGALEPTSSQRVEWGILLGRQVSDYVVGESDLDGADEDGGPLSNLPGRTIWVADTYATGADAVAACQGFVVALAGSEVTTIPPTECWALGPDGFFERIPPPVTTEP